MADLLSIDLTTTQTAAQTTFTVKVVAHFSAREIMEDFSYGVNVAVMREDTSVMVVPIPRGMQGMSWSTDPTFVPNFVVTTGSQVIRPGGQTQIEVTIVRSVPALAQGARHNAWACITPEIASMAYLSPPSVVP